MPVVYLSKNTVLPPFVKNTLNLFPASVAGRLKEMDISSPDQAADTPVTSAGGVTSVTIGS